MAEENLSIYNAVRQVPPAALKKIEAGRLKGKSDINPMWRIKALTEQFGPCGVGWKYEIAEKRLERGAGDEIAAFVDINLYIKYNGEWSKAIPGTGGSSFVAKESKGLYTSDECFKMALTDAISVSCKALGFAADVYWDKDNTKYSKQDDKKAPPPADTISVAQAKRMFALAKGNADIVRAMLNQYGYDRSEQVKKTEYDAICNKILGVANAAEKKAELQEKYAEEVPPAEEVFPEDGEQRLA